MLIQIILLFLLVWLFVLRWQRRKLIELSHKLGVTNHMTLPFVGHAYIFFGSDEDRMTKFQKLGREAIASKHGITTIWQGHRLYLVVSDAMVAELLLKTCLEKDDAVDCLRFVTGNGSIFAPVSIWRPRRKVLAPTFSPKNLQQFAEIFSRQSSIMVEQLQAAVGKGAFSIWQYITTYTMDSVCETTLGVLVNSQKQSEQPFLKAFDKCTQLDADRLCKPWFHPPAIYEMTPVYKLHLKCRNYICKFVDQIIKTKKETLAEEKVSMAESEQSKLYSDPLGFYFVEDDDAPVQGLYHSLELIKLIVDWSKLIVNTVLCLRSLEVFGNSKRPVVAEDLPRLKYLDAVIRETLRMYPPVPIIARKIDKEITLPRMKAFQVLGLDALKKENGLTSLWLANRLYTIVADPEAADTILKSISEKDDIIRMASVFIGNGSIFAPVSIWRPRRKVLVPTFSTKNLKYFMTIFASESDILVKEIGRAAGNAPISIFKYFTAFTMDAIARTTMGYKMNAQKDSSHFFLKGFDMGLDSFAERICQPWLHSDAIYKNLPLYSRLMKHKKEMWDFMTELIRNKRREIKDKNLTQEQYENSSEYNQTTFLESLMRFSGGDDGYTDDEIVEELLVIMVAGTDTSAVGASFVSVVLSRYPEIQKKVFKELQEVFGDSDRQATFEDIPRLKYLEAVIKETLRLYAPVPVMTRKVEKDLYLRYQYAMMSMKTMLSTVLRRYKFLPATQPDKNSEFPPLRLKFDIMMKDEDGFQVCVEPRTKLA
ncbi:hypothetical protein HF086_000025 [Spodoptera exigua]|uniref:Cytochrome p450 n=1 Tax=Spodoptera exigua TaxID=7107 RepID=A0A922SP01_SPOEX|nr:hypothetical protein HF086_000025 [Spodoptera exigua]